MNDSARSERTESNRGTLSRTTIGSILLILAMVMIVVSALVPMKLWPMHGVLLVVVFVLLTVWDVPIRWIWRRLKWFLPLISLFALSVPLSQGFDGGVELMWAIIIRGVLSFMTILWLSQALPFPGLLQTLKAWRVPGVLLSMLSMMHRYSVVMWNELNSMRTARRARIFNGTSLRTRWLSNGRMIGMLLIRSLTRAERIHSAMQARGWNGTLHDFEFEPADSNR